MAVAKAISGQLVYKKPIQGGQQHPNPGFCLRLVPDTYDAYVKCKGANWGEEPVVLTMFDCRLFLSAR